MHLAIRADGGPKLGYGHLVRSNALAEEFRSRDNKVTVSTTTPQSARSVFPDTAEIIELPSRGDPEPFLNWLDANQPDAVFTDSYPVDTEYQREVRDRIPLAVLQDDNRHAVCADLFINGNLYAPDLDYEFVGDEPKTCLGTDYVLLRSEIRDRAEDEPPWRERPERALVIMGGSDIANLMPTAVRAFDGFDIYVDAIVGPGFSETQERSIRAAAEEISADVSVARDPDDLVERMFQADFAVSSSSSTTYELLALGTPIVSVPVADNQEPIARTLREHDVATVLEDMPSKGSVLVAVGEYFSNSDLRRDRQEYGRTLVDGQGTQRIASAVERQLNT
jgi:UDP-2,4-diacetamido-2,4,6-trideoxy-beta-L-altropyranose hydrolase